MEYCSSDNFALNVNVKREVGDLMMVVGNGNCLVKPVMTDEQVDVLRLQIAVFATICEQLVEMHKSISAHQDAIAGTSLGNIYCDPSMINGNSPKIAPRQRWTPTQFQLQILENIFQLGNGTPSKQRIKKITSELQAHGQISETNVYNWFQNRRARSKRKQATTIETENERSKANQLMGEEEILHGFQHGSRYTS